MFRFQQIQTSLRTVEGAPMRRQHQHFSRQSAQTSQGSEMRAHRVLQTALRIEADVAGNGGQQLVSGNEQPGGFRMQTGMALGMAVMQRDLQWQLRRCELAVVFERLRQRWQFTHHTAKHMTGTGVLHETWIVDTPALGERGDTVHMQVMKLAGTSGKSRGAHGDTHAAALRQPAGHPEMIRVVMRY